jgi:hypothetical protein
MNPNSPKAKRLLKEQADAEKDLPKSSAPGPMAKDRVASAAAIGAASNTKADYLAPPKKVTTATTKKSVDLSGFGEAFKKARAEGVGTKFAYDDKMYSAVTKDDISRSGKSSLQDFLNSTKRTETTIAKAPGQIVQKKSGGEMSGAAVTNSEAKPMPFKPGTENKYKKPLFRPKLKERLIRRSEEAKKMNIELKNRSGAAVTEGEMQSLMEQMNKPRSMDRFKSGGSVMARGCKMGRKKPTKIY